MKDNKCPLCEGRLKAEKVPYSFAGKTLGRFAAEVCQKCGETFFMEEGWDEIEAASKRAGLWGIGRRAKIGYSGHSLIVRIPAELAEAAHFKRGTTVYLQPAGQGKLLVESEAD